MHALRQVLLRDPPSKRSLQFVSASSQYLSRTPSTFTNNKIGTVSVFFRRSSTGANMNFMSPNEQGGPTGGWMRTNSSDRLEVLTYGAGDLVNSTQTVTDTTNWHHAVFSIDTTQATAANRIKIYLDGAEVSYNSSSYPAQNLQFFYATGWTIGKLNFAAAELLNGYYDEFIYVDGEQLQPSRFAYGNRPIPYRGSYGAAGFRLSFDDAASTTTLGLDSSGNGNHWTLNAMTTANSNAWVPGQ